MKPTLCDRLAAYLKARPETWIDGMELAQVAGSYAWRSRCADLRKRPYEMDIRNRQQRITRADGSKYVISEYAYFPSAQTEAA